MVAYDITNFDVWYASIIFSKKMLPEVHTTGTYCDYVKFAEIWDFLTSTPHICGLKNVPYEYTKNEKTFFSEGWDIRWKVFTIISHLNNIVSTLKYFEKVAVF